MSVAELRDVTEVLDGGAPPRHIDLTTAQLDRLARSWIDVQQTRKALAQRELDDDVIAAFLTAEQKLSRALTKTLRSHVLWPWLSQFPGLGGAHTALVIGRIGDPRRFPGQRCSEGHYLPPLYAVGAPCPIAGPWPESDVLAGDSDDVGADESSAESESRDVCPGVMLPPRETTGVRSLWHWAGLHADTDSRAPRKRKGVRCDWEPRVRASVMQPGGIAEQIVRLSVPHYVDEYRAAKERLNLRVVEKQLEGLRVRGDASNGAATETSPESDRWTGRPLRPFEADRIARKVAAKAFLGDLLTTWKELA
jgi:hypothetical protein